MADEEDNTSAQAEEWIAAVEYRRKLSGEWANLHYRKFAPGAEALTEAEDQRFWYLIKEILALLANEWELATVDPLASFSLEAEVMRVAAGGIQQALAGHLPKAWRESSDKPYREQQSGVDLAAIRLTAAYYMAIRNGLFSDPKANKFLRALFDVARKTINNWAKEDPGEHYNLLHSTLLKHAGEDTRREKARAWLSRMAELQRRREI